MRRFPIGFIFLILFCLSISCSTSSSLPQHARGHTSSSDDPERHRRVLRPGVSVASCLAPVFHPPLPHPLAHNQPLPSFCVRLTAAVEPAAFPRPNQQDGALRVLHQLPARPRAVQGARKVGGVLVAVLEGGGLRIRGDVEVTASETHRKRCWDLSHTVTQMQ